MIGLIYIAFTDDPDIMLFRQFASPNNQDALYYSLFK
jgi:hypothetical protein